MVSALHGLEASRTVDELARGGVGGEDEGDAGADVGDGGEGGGERGARGRRVQRRDGVVEQQQQAAQEVLVGSQRRGRGGRVQTGREGVQEREAEGPPRGLLRGDEGWRVLEEGRQVVGDGDVFDAVGGQLRRVEVGDGAEGCGGDARCEELDGEGEGGEEWGFQEGSDEVTGDKGPESRRGFGVMYAASRDGNHEAKTLVEVDVLLEFRIV